MTTSLARHQRARGNESVYARTMRLNAERARLTVRCTRCGWRYTGRTITAVRKAREHRAEKHPDLPVVTPQLKPKSAYCKVDGCHALAATKVGRYARLCEAHRTEAQGHVAAPRPARPAAAKAPRAPRPATPPPRGRGYVKLDQAACKVPGCVAPPALTATGARRMSGMLAGLCAEHGEAKIVAVYGPRPVQRPPRKPNKAWQPLDPEHCKTDGCEVPPVALRGMLAGLCAVHAAAKSEELRTATGECKIAGCAELWVRPGGKGAHLCLAHLHEVYPPRSPGTRRVYHRKFTDAMRACAQQLLAGDITQRQLAQAAYEAWGFGHYKNLERLLGPVREAAGKPPGKQAQPVPVYNRAEVAAMVAAAVRG